MRQQGNGWQQRSGNGWQPQAGGGTPSSMNRDASARSRGASREASRPSGGTRASRGGGGRRR
jgi:hypothetical protein